MCARAQGSVLVIVEKTVHSKTSNFIKNYIWILQVETRAVENWPTREAIRPTANTARDLCRERAMSSSSLACASQPLRQTFEQRRVTANTPVALVTGAAGFIGSHVAEVCATRLGFTVVAVDDLSGGFARNLEPWIRSGHSRFVRGDVQNRSFVSALFAEHGPFDYVYHLAAYAAEGLSHFVREFNYNNNLGASVLLLNHAVNQEERTGRAVARFVFTSSIAAFGAVEDPSELPMTEATPQRPEDPYGIAKHAFELDLRAAGRMFGLPFTIFRPHNVYGPRQNIADKFRNAVGIFMNQVLRGEPLSIFGDGRQTRCFSYVDDVAPIIAASVLYPATAGETLALWHWYSDMDDAVLVLALAHSRSAVFPQARTTSSVPTSAPPCSSSRGWSRPPWVSLPSPSCTWTRAMRCLRPRRHTPSCAVQWRRVRRLQP